MDSAACGQYTEFGDCGEHLHRHHHHHFFNHHEVISRASSHLPFTGMDVALVLLIAVIMLLAGIALGRAVNRRRHRTD